MSINNLEYFLTVISYRIVVKWYLGEYLPKTVLEEGFTFLNGNVVVLCVFLGILA